MDNEVLMGQAQSIYKGGRSSSITFCVTEDCNLACKYCYMTGKNKKNKMSLEIAKKAVDFYLSKPKGVNLENSVVWEFIGGEPFLEIDLIDQICDYIKLRMYELNHEWFNNYIFSFSTNGLLYRTEKVQKYIQKNKNHLSICISIDGNKIKHDSQRVKLDGSGSYDEVIESAKLWLKQFPNAQTKATFSHDDLIYLKDSVISLWELGIKIVPANIVFEEVWENDDEAIFEEQLKALADYIIDNNLYTEHSIRFFEPTVGIQMTKADCEKNFCGAGKMNAVDWKGDIYPCIRFLDFTLNNKKGRAIGNINDGIDEDKVRPFWALTMKAQSKEECIECEVGGGCSWCVGYDYDNADTPTIYQRATSICKMHKANVRANKYFWNRMKEVTGVDKRETYKLTSKETEAETDNKKVLLMVLDDRIKPHCSYKNDKNSNMQMTEEIFKKGIDFAIKNNYMPAGLTQDNSGNTVINYNITDYHEAITCSNNKTGLESVSVYKNEIGKETTENIILTIDKTNINNLYSTIESSPDYLARVNLVLDDVTEWTEEDIQNYEAQLERLSSLLFEKYKMDKPIEISSLTDIFYNNSLCDCGAGEKMITLAPDGKLYICPAFYFDENLYSIGDLDDGIKILNGELLSIEKAPVCGVCDAYHCKRCKYQNIRNTMEINTPSRNQCIVSHLERECSRKLQLRLINEDIYITDRLILKIDYNDPFDKLIEIIKSS